MDYHKHFLPEHVEQAEKEHIAISECLRLINLHSEDGRFIMSRDRMQDALKSINNLIDLSALKEDEDE